MGTTTYDRDLVAASRNPLDFENVMYTLHFYAATHGIDLQRELVAALESGLPVFVTECGLSEASGDGRVDFDSAVAWFELLAEHDISFTVWSLSNKSEASAFIKARSSEVNHLSDDDLTPVGLWVRSLLQGVEPALIEQPAVEDGALEDTTPEWVNSLGNDGLRPALSWKYFAFGAVAFLAVNLAGWLVYKHRIKGRVMTYDDLVGIGKDSVRSQGIDTHSMANRIAIALSSFFTLVYLMWRVCFSVPVEAGWLAICANIVLLIVEVLGFVESLIHYESMVGIREHPLPTIADDEYPDVDIFIATYNEPVKLLRMTVNGCNHLQYPDRSKVHIWICDDNRRPEMRALADEMGVGYFDRPDNQGAKAGNLNAAMARTSAPYVVTLDADMIVKSDFLLKTVPYFVDAEKRAAQLPEGERRHLGLLQTPQCFYEPDVFQHALYAETRIPNEQDFFYRTIEPAKTSTNSVIYGGSNTMLSRKALEDVGGFYTESITEDFATGLMIESAGYLSLAIGEPLASGCTPHTFKEHIQQRTRWGRGVIVTGRKLKLFRRSGLTLAQRLSYWSSVVYWYSPLKNLIYVLSPLLFAVFCLPVFSCTWFDLVVYWLPMFAAQSLCLRVVSGNAISVKWSGVHETSVMPYLLLPILKESLGITLSAFKVTDKSAASGKREKDVKTMRPFIVLAVLSVAGIVRVVWLLVQTRAVGLFVLLFWLIRNLYYIVMALFLIDGRDYDGEMVKVKDAIMVEVRQKDLDDAPVMEGVATYLTDHSIRVFLEEDNDLIVGRPVVVTLYDREYEVQLEGMVVGLVQSRFGSPGVQTIEIMDLGKDDLEYLQVLFDRVPSLPQNLNRDLWVLPYLWHNIVMHLGGLGY